MTNQSRKLFLQLGRLGDIINILPLVKYEYDQTGNKPMLMVARAFASILDGVTYCEPVIFEGPFENVHLAMFQARKLIDNITLCQIYGDGLPVKEECISFARESWKQANAPVPWGSLPVVFDNRNSDRENALANRVFAPGRARRTVLVAAHGVSSPFPYARLLVSQLRADLPVFDLDVVDISELRAERFYDLLGLFERAHCLVAIDTGHQHLAAACGVPVVSLVTRDPSPWHGSPWRPEHVGRFYYDEVKGCIHEIVMSAVTARMDQPKIIHTWCDFREYLRPAETQRRINIAAQSWENEYKTGRWIPAEYAKEHALRTGKDIGDPDPIPFAKDAIEHAIRHASSCSDIICLTNADVGFAPGLTGRIFDAVARTGCAFSHRRDFHKLMNAPVSEAALRKAVFYPGSDGFFFTVKWWREHGHEYDDYVMGREHWDEVLRQLIKYHGGPGIEYSIFHEWHESTWCGEGRYTLAGNLHNAKLKQGWFDRTGFQKEDFRYFRVIEMGHTHP